MSNFLGIIPSICIKRAGPLLCDITQSERWVRNPILGLLVYVILAGAVSGPPQLIQKRPAAGWPTLNLPHSPKTSCLLNAKWPPPEWPPDWATLDPGEALSCFTKFKLGGVRAELGSETRNGVASQGKNRSPKRVVLNEEMQCEEMFAVTEDTKDTVRWKQATSEGKGWEKKRRRND